MFGTDITWDEYQHFILTHGSIITEDCEDKLPCGANRVMWRHWNEKEIVKYFKNKEKND